jgi:AraC-like DNA-binding protein
VDTVLFQSNLFKIGNFVINPDDPEFHRKGLIENPLIVFPKNTILIQHQHKDPFVADTTLINLYNKQQEYQRFSMNGKGDDCHWVELSNELLQQIKTPNSKNVFCSQNINCDSKTFLLAYKIFKHICNKNTQPLKVEECIIEVLNKIHLVSNIRKNNSLSKLNHIKLVERIKINIHNNIANNQLLTEISSDVFSSPFHISRVFKQVTGIGIHQFRNQIRLKSVFTKIHQGEGDLANLALNHGFSSHSHLSFEFKKYFGFTPSSLMC